MSAGTSQMSCCSMWGTKPQPQATFLLPSHEHDLVLQQCELLLLFLPFPSPHQGLIHQACCIELEINLLFPSTAC